MSTYKAFSQVLPEETTISQNLQEQGSTDAHKSCKVTYIAKKKFTVVLALKDELKEVWNE